MKKLSLLIISVLLLISACGRPSHYREVLTLWNYYERAEKSGNNVNPYLLNVLAGALADRGQKLKEIRVYITWYFERMNYPDSSGLTATIYDYHIDPDGAEKPSGEYDSADSYAATFIMLLEKYSAATGDFSLIKENWKKVQDCVYVIAALQDEDGLTRAVPTSDAKYLMDNCEAYAGILAYQRLCSVLGKEKESYYDASADAIKEGIKEQFLNNASGLYCWGISGGVKSGPGKDVYPDRFAQIFPFVFGLSDDPGPLQKFIANPGKKIVAFPLEQRIIIGEAALRLNLEITKELKH